MPTTEQHTDRIATNLMGGLVRCHNNMSVDFISSYAGTRFLIPANGDMIVPIEAMWDWAGRPWVTDKDHHRERSEELERLKVRYGVFSDNDPRIDRSDAEAWAANVPDLTFSALDSPETYITVLQDPEGRSVTAVDTTYQEKAALESRYNELQKQVKAMQTALAQTELRNYVPSADAAAEDVPQKVPVKDPEDPGRRRRSS